MSSNLPSWKTLRSNNLKKRPAYVEPVVDHPLKNLVVIDRIPRRILGSAPSTGRTTPVLNTTNISEPLALALKQLDPLTELALREELDPLSRIVAEREERLGTVADLKDESQNQDNIAMAKGDLDKWSSRKAFILQKYTTSEKLSMVTSFLSEGEKVVVKAQSTAVDKIQHRLEQLDSFEEGSQHKLDLSQSEYIFKINQLNKELVIAWNQEQRVKALKIAIQCAKMLSDTEVLPFYPSKFVLITDILDCFGRLVYERLHSKAVYYKPGTKVQMPLPEDFTPDMVPDSAKETCLNWFFKIASIRELVPRLYVEMALLKSYNFISSNEGPEALRRLTEMIQGIGNPLVAVYVRCYLCRVGLNITMSSDLDFFRKNFESFLENYQHLFSRGVKGELHSQKMTLSTYMTLYTPALDFLMEHVVLSSQDNALSELLSKCKQYSSSSLILNTIMSGFKPQYISDRTLQFLTMIGQCTDDGIPLHSLLRTLGLCVSVSPPPVEHKKQILNTVWSNIAQLHSPLEYVGCVEVWIPFIAQHFTTREVNTVLGDLIDRLLPDRRYENFPSELKTIIYKIVQNTPDFEALLAMENLLPVIDLFHEESAKVEVCKTILSSKSLHDQTTGDPVISNALMFLGGILHDSVNALTPEDENRQIGEILCNVVRMVHFGRDFERQLQFYVDARGAFANLDSVLIQLVRCVNLLAVDTRQIVKRAHTRKTGDFVRACAAYCFITIPSIESPKARLRLYLLSGQVGLFNQCLGQADACFKAILTVIPELPPRGDTESFLLPFVRQLLSALLVVPDNPERGVLSLIRMLLNLLRAFEWTTNQPLGFLYVNVIDLFSIMAQDFYPYHVDKVESNDALWGADPRFLKEIDNMTAIIIGQVLGLLKEMGPCRKQAQLAAELFYRVATRGDLNVNQVSTLALNLWNLCIKHGHADVAYLARLKNYLLGHSLRIDSDPLRLLLDKLSLPQ
ncbi:VPS35 endosomal protein-sorting factor-like isoform X1 [Euwallacea similis]|uniref:VPS35 endosomal protein-sorting factor-like isoform X1 n=2 Tax=Euwallacea similis TaxID=1736056 RepID=UPI003450BA66